MHKLVVSLYDGPEQIDQMHSLFKEAGATEDSYILRDRWYDEDEDYGLKLTNRGGTIDFGADRAHCDTVCYYPAYMMMIDWNGDVFLCTQDWNRRIKSGNLNYESLLKVWANLKRFRNNFMRASGLARHVRGAMRMEKSTVESTLPLGTNSMAKKVLGLGKYFNGCGTKRITAVLTKKNTLLKRCRVWDLQGNTYVDMAMAGGSAILGHADKSIIDAASSQFASQIFIYISVFISTSVL